MILFIKKHLEREAATHVVVKKEKCRTHLIVDVHASIQQHLHHRQVSVPRGQVQRCVFLCVAAEQVGVGAEQQFDHLQTTVQRGQIQWGLELVVPHGGVRQFI